MTNRNKLIKTQPRLLMGLLVALLLILLTACADNSNNEAAFNVSTPAASKGALSESGTKIDPCKLITDEELAAIMGGSVKTRENTARGPFVMCNYEVDNKSFATKTFLVSVNIQASSKSSFKLEVDQAARGLEAKAEPMPGVGEEAYSLHQDFYYVYKNKVSFNLYFVYGDKEPGTLEKAKAVAIKMAERL